MNDAEHIVLVIAGDVRPKGAAEAAALAEALKRAGVTPVVVPDEVVAMLALGRAQFGAVVLVAASSASASAAWDVFRVAKLRHPGVPMFIVGVNLELPNTLVTAVKVLNAASPALLVLAVVDAMKRAGSWEGETAVEFLDEATHDELSDQPLLEGAFARGTGAALLMSIWGQELTGRLTVRGGAAAGDLLFLGGDPVAADAPMVQKRAPAPPAVEADARERVLALVAQGSGSYAFVLDTSFVGQRRMSRVNPFGLLLEANRRRIGPNAIIEQLARIEHKYLHAGVGLALAASRLKPFTRDVDIATIIDGRTTGRELFVAAGLDPLIGAVVVLTLEEAQLVTLADAPAVTNPSVRLGEITGPSTEKSNPYLVDIPDDSTFDAQEFAARVASMENAPPELHAIPDTQPDSTTNEGMRYELLERIGNGGMAEVFLARALGAEGFEKKVALKRILPVFSRKKSFVDMFLEEARVAARVSHPNVVELFGVGRAGDDYYLVMEFVDGADLQSLLELAQQQGNEMPLEISARIVSDICAGLHAAHTAPGGPIIHRDVSPQNVLVSNDGHVKLTDFGIAKPADSRLHTAVGARKGKRSYLSPEYMDGKPADARSDIFAAGIILYMCITGAHPFMRSNLLDGVTALREADMTPLQTLRVRVPVALAGIVSRALARDPDARYQTARDFQLALDGFAASSGVPAFAPQIAAWVSAVKKPAVTSSIPRTRIVLKGV